MCCSNKHEQIGVKRLKHARTLVRSCNCIRVHKAVMNFKLFIWDWAGLWWLADRPIEPRGLSAVTGVLLIWWGVRTRLGALHRLAGLPRPGRPCDPLREKRGMGRRACVFSSCYVHVSPDLFFSVPPFLFWCCLWFPVVQFCLSQWCMTETGGRSSVSSL